MVYFTNKITKYLKPKVKVKTLDFGATVWYNAEGLIHKEGGPAIVHSDGTKFWYVNGRLHRKNGPAIVRTDGHKEWWLNGRQHKEDGPAVIRSSGMYEWWLHGVKHHFRDWINLATLDEKEKAILILKYYR